MSMDLYEGESRERMANFAPVTSSEASAFDGFVRGTAMHTMRGLARVASSIDLMGSVAPITYDAFTGGTEAQDKYFKEHQDFAEPTLDYWTPRPNEVGVAGQVAGQLLGTLPVLLASPGLAVADVQLGTAEELIQKGVSAGRAQAVGAVQAAGLGLGIWVPILGRNGWERVLVGGAGFNVLQGVTTRAASGLVLEGTPARDDYKAFDGEALTIDVLLGMAFGSMAHLSPAMRAQGKEAWERIGAWAQRLEPSDVAALAALRQAQHLNEDSAPGRPATPEDVQAHADRVKLAIDQVLRGDKVEVEAEKAPTFEPDKNRQQQAKERVGELEQAAEEVRAQENLTPLPETAPEPVRVGGLEAAEIGSQVRERLVTMGMPEDQATANSTLWEAFFRTTAKRMGITPGELYERYPVDITAAAPEGEVLMQRRYPELPKLKEQYENSQITAGELAFEIEALADGGRAPDRLSDLAHTYLKAVREAEHGEHVDLDAPEEAFLTAFDKAIAGDAARDNAPQGQRFYSELWRQVEASKQQQAPAQGWKDLLKSFSQKGVKAEEIKWSGIEEWLDLQQGRVTKDQVLEFLKGNGVKVEEIMLGGPRSPSLGDSAIATEARLLERAGYYIEQNPDDTSTIAFHDRQTEDLVTADEIRQYAEQHRDRPELGQAAIAARRVEEYWAGRASRSERQPADEAIHRTVEELENEGYEIAQDHGMADMPGEQRMWVINHPDNERAYQTNEDIQNDTDLPDSIRSRLKRVLEYLNTPTGWAQVEGGPIEQPTKFGNYQLPGGKNYRELLLTLPHDENALPKGYKIGKTEAGVRNAEKRLEDISERYGAWLDSFNLPRVSMDEVPMRDLSATQQAQLKDFIKEWDNATNAHDRAQRTKYVLERPDGVGQALEAANETEAMDAAMKVLDVSGELDKGVFRESHWEHSNVLAHVRLNERTDAEGKKVLFVEEIQSDWAQKGKKRGFQGDRDAAWYTRNGFTAEPVHRDTFEIRDPEGNAVGTETAAYEGEAIAAFAARKQGNVPGGPFVGKTESWVGLVVKRMIAYAVENGFDRVAWTTGEQQTKRYTSALRKAVDEIEWTKTDKGVQIVGYKGGRKSRPSIDEPHLATLESRYDLADRMVIEARDALLRAVGPTPRDALGGEPKIVTRQADVPDMLDVELLQGQKLLVYERGHILQTEDGRYDVQIGRDERQFERLADAEKYLWTDWVSSEHLADFPNAPAAARLRNEMNTRFEIGRELYNAKKPPPGDRTKVVDTTEKEDVLSDAIGKAMADQILSDPNQSGVISGDGIHVADTGMASFYDRIVPNVAKDVLKKLGGGRVGEVKFSATPDWPGPEKKASIFGKPKGEDHLQQGFDITPAMAEKVKGGLALFQSGPEGTPRGYLRGRAGEGQPMTIGILQADASTFGHESAHFFLEVTNDLARANDAPPALKADMQTLYDWLGVKDADTWNAMPLEEQRPMHEKFARGFEQYLRKGEAPTPELRTVFELFRDWLVAIYKSAKQLGVKVSKEVQGVMDRMLAEQEAKGSPASGGRTEPPPPRGSPQGEGGPEAQGIDPWAMPQEHEAPSRSAGLTLESDKMRSSLEGMAKYETGWEVVGGKRQRADMRGGEVNFTPWIPKAEWWRHRPVKMNEDQTQEAVRKALAGEELTKNQKRMVDYMVDVSNERMAEVDELGQQEWNAITADLKDTGLEPTTRDVVDTDLTAKAAAIDERAVENAAVRYENDDAAFMAEIQRIIDEANPDAAAAGSGEKGSGKAPAGGSTPDAAAGSPNQAGEGKPGAEGEKAGADPLAAAAERYVLEEPTRLLRVGTNADGTPDYRTAQQYLEEARADAAQAREDSKLFEIAANCLLGGGR